MTRVNIPRTAKEVIEAMDCMIEEPFVILDNPLTRRKIGMYTKQLRDDGSLGLYWDERLRETIGVLKVKNVEKIIGKTVEYRFQDFKIKLPRIEL